MTKSHGLILALPLAALVVGGCAVVPERDGLVVRPIYPAAPVYAPPPPMVYAQPAQVIYVPQPPPPPQVEIMPALPPMADTRSHVWIAGHWFWNGAGYVWRPGHYERRPRPGAVWVEGRWEHQGGHGYVWVEGRWR